MDNLNYKLVLINEPHLFQKFIFTFINNHMDDDVRPTIQAESLWLGSVEGKLNDLWQIYKLYAEQTRSLNDWSPYERSGCDQKNFKQRMPIFVSLKNEALKERHWKTMIDKTGAGIDFYRTLSHCPIYSKWICFNLQMK